MIKIKLIWDFTGPDALLTAKHHAIHLNEYGTAHLGFCLAGYESLSDEKALAYMILDKEDMVQVRDVLRPKRGEYVD